MTLNAWLGRPAGPPVYYIPRGKIRCYLTGRLYKDTKEERVLQAVLHELIDVKGYSRRDMQRNFRIVIAGETARPDIVVFVKGGHHRQENIYIVVEVEPEERKPTDPKHGVNQLRRYFLNLPNCTYGMWTNGRVRICFERYYEGGIVKIREIFDIPPAGRTRAEDERPSFDRLRPATYELRIVLRNCHDYIHANQGLPKDKAFMELLKVMFCKLYDEKYSKTVTFYATSEERETEQGLLAIHNRIQTLFEQVKKKWPHIFPDPKEIIELKPRVLAYIVGKL